MLEFLLGSELEITIGMSSNVTTKLLDEIFSTWIMIGLYYIILSFVTTERIFCYSFVLSLSF